MKVFALLAVALATAAGGCKTAGSSALRGVDRASAGGLHCKFDVPNGSGDGYEVWATPTDGSQLTNVSERLYSGKTGPEDVRAIGSAPAFNAASLKTKEGDPAIRGYEKDLQNVDIKAFSCFTLVESAQRKGYLCLARPGTPQKPNEALWISNYSHHVYRRELTLFSTVCSG